MNLATFEDILDVLNRRKPIAATCSSSRGDKTE